jgi:gluconokinase
VKPAEPLVLTLDVGTSSTRAMLYDGRGRSVPDSETKLAYQPRVALDGTAELDAGRLERLVTMAVDGTLRQAPRLPVAAVGLSTFWHGLVGTDEKTGPTTPVILWMDTRSWRQSARLREELDPEEVRLRTGCPIHPSYWPAKLAWLRETAPEVWGKTRHWLSFGDLVYERIFGELGTSASMASGTGLRQLTGGWTADLLDRLGVQAASVPPEITEMRRPKAAYTRRWPQLADAVWFTAAGDGGLANLGSGCVDRSQRALTVGTSGALRVLTDSPPPKLPAGLWCYLLDERRYVVGGALSNGGNLYAWLLRTLNLDRRKLEAHLRKIQPGDSGLVFLPLLAGERSLGYAAHARGAMAGLTQASTAEEIAEAGLIAVALTFAAVDQALDEGLPGADRLVASGGALLASPAWVQVMADAIGKPVAVSRSLEASSQGAAELALERLGVIRKPTTRVGRTFVPRGAAHTAYREAQLRQEWLYDVLIKGRS